MTVSAMLEVGLDGNQRQDTSLPPSWLSDLQFSEMQQRFNAELQ